MKLILKISLFALGAFLIGHAALAASTSGFPYELEVPFPGQNSVTDLVDYLDLVIKFVIGTAGILSTMMIIYGGFRWATAMGNSGIVSKAQEIIVSAVVGLIIALGSYLILNFINPALTTLKDPAIMTIELLGTCKVASDCANLTCSGGYTAYCQDEVCECTASALTGGTTCATDANCTTGKCRGDSAIPGAMQCSDGSEGQYCNTSEVGIISTGTNITCQTGLTCTEREVGGVATYACTNATTTGKASGELCSAKGECTSGICHSANKTCYNGDGTDKNSAGGVMPCGPDDANCAAGYFCAQVGDSAIDSQGPGYGSTTCELKIDPDIDDVYCQRNGECLSNNCHYLTTHRCE